MNVKELRNELEEVMNNNKVNFEDIQEMEEIIAPACGCGCGSSCR